MVQKKLKLNTRKRLSFKNRKSIIRDIDSHLKIYDENIQYFKVLTLIGMGGFGKSRLIDKISSISKDYKFKTVRVSVETESSISLVAPLKAIRNQLNFDCLLFDTALLRYWSASGQVYTLQKSSQLSKSFALKVAEFGVGFMETIPLSLTFAVTVYEKAKKKIVKVTHYSKDEFKIIDDFSYSSEKLLKMLPDCLGIDIRRHQMFSFENYVFFYDSYEKQKKHTLDENCSWLRTFISSLEMGLHIIASREALNWTDKYWQNIIEKPYIVDSLPVKDVRKLIISECDPPETHLNALVKVSRCIPFYVGVVINDYSNLKSSKKTIDIRDIPLSSKEAVYRFINHLDESMQKLIISISVIQFFNERLIKYIIRQLNLNIDFIAINDIANSFFIEIVDDLYYVYKTHDLLTDFVRSEPSYLEISKLTILASAQLMSLMSQDNHINSNSLMFYSGICEGAPKGISNEKLIEYMIDFGYAIYDAGYWEELSCININSFNSNLSSIEIVQFFFHAIAQRRIVSVETGITKLEKISTYREEFGRHIVSFDLEVAYLTELSGKYSIAKQQISKIYKSNSPIDHLNPKCRPQFRSLLYHTDFLIMDGDFTEGEEILLIASETTNYGNNNKAELIRHRAHSFRFSFLFEQAEILYLDALDIAADIPSMRAKLQTNLAETRCWISPEIAIENAMESIRLNKQLGNKIEVSKAYSALSIAYIHLGNLENARKNQILARTISEDVQYLSGVLFSKISLCLIEASDKKVQNISKLRQEILDLTIKLETYDHLNLVPA